MLKKLRHELGALGLRQSPATLPTEAWLFLALCFAMALAYTVFSDQFGKLGLPLPLPSGLGSIPNFQPKLFPMEIFLLAAGFLTLFTWKHWKAKQLLHPLGILVLFVLAFGFIRSLPDLRANPVLVVRNSAFVWYLSLPVIIALLPLPSRTWETFFRALYLVVFLYFVACLSWPFWYGNLRMMFWSIDLGLLLALAFGLCGPKGILPHVALCVLGFAVGLSYFGSLQRTTLLGLGITLAILAVAYFFPARFPRPRWVRLAGAAAGAILAVGAASAFHSWQKGDDLISTGVNAIATAAPGRVAEKNSFGFEKFRYYMWKDSFDLFLSAPLHGIGFLRPVVHRAYAGAGQFMENSGSFEQLSQFRYEKTSPPIAGPHNSYLNALARLGALGAAYLLLHLVIGTWFLQRGYYACAFVLLWQMLYAAFNVSFEGPIRSFPILLLTGVGLKIGAERREK